ncbi:MAG: hypothetical protein K0S61_2687 [Anaerocolumna sp.]|nr:hypothetical protein [Anaerocolumna sp.]
MDYTNEMLLEFDSLSKNESFARMVVAGFVAGLDPTVEEIADIKTAVSEAVTNAIIHGYEEEKGKICINCKISGQEIYIEIKDHGKGIEDIEKAMEPLYTTKPDMDRSGMGFSFMEAFMDDLEVESKLGVGTTVKMKKKIH